MLHRLERYHLHHRGGAADTTDVMEISLQLATDENCGPLGIGVTLWGPNISSSADKTCAQKISKRKHFQWVHATIRV